MSVDPPEVSKRLRERLDARFTFLSDPEGELLDAIGIRHQGGRADGGDIAWPTSMLVDNNGIVQWLFQSDTYRERATPEDIFPAIESLSTGAR